MKNRMLSLLLAMGMLASLAACQTKEETDAPPAQDGEQTPVEQAPAAEDAPKTVVVNGMELGMGLVMEEEAAAALDENPDRDIDRAVTPIVPVPDAMLDGTALGEEFYYYRSTLDETGKQAYDLIRTGLLEGKSKISMTVPVTTDQIFDLYKMVIFDGPELFWAEVNGMRYSYNNSGIVLSLMPGYNDLVSDIPGNTARFESAVAEALADMWSLSTDGEKAKYAHDYLTHYLTYDLNAPYNQNAYSALVNQTTVCAGYAHGFQYMMQQMGIPCAYVLGYAMGGYHAWNIVELDGEHYAMDVTWDDPIGAPAGAFYYNYFNITDQTLETDHTRADISLSVPVAEGTACSFQNAFGGNAYGTDFAAIVGVMPEKILPPEGDGEEVVDNPYLG